MPSLTNATQKLPLNTLDAILAALSLPPQELITTIDNHDGDFVTFHYNRHEDDQYVQETLPAMEFIERLIQHIPQKHYKMIRYGGLYGGLIPDTGRLTKSCTVPSPVKNTIFLEALTNGVEQFFLLSVMTL